MAAADIRGPAVMAAGTGQSTVAAVGISGVERLAGDMIGIAVTAGITMVVVQASTSDMARHIPTTLAITIRQRAGTTMLTAKGMRTRAAMRRPITRDTEAGLPNR